MTTLQYHLHELTRYCRMDLILSVSGSVNRDGGRIASLLTLHFLSVGHVLPPSHANSVVYENNWKHTIWRDHVKFLNCLI
jgi:hypothetical protein